jgi:hypothetical protein
MTLVPRSVCASHAVTARRATRVRDFSRSRERVSGGSVSVVVAEMTFEHLDHCVDVRLGRALTWWANLPIW